MLRISVFVVLFFLTGCSTAFYLDEVPKGVEYTYFKYDRKGNSTSTLVESENAVKTADGVMVEKTVVKHSNPLFTLDVELHDLIYVPTEEPKDAVD